VPSVETDHLVVLHDDVDLPLGQVRVSFGRGSGGHNGIASIIDSLGTKDFIRVRLGIAPTSLFTGLIKRPVGEKMPKFVLGNFSARELVKVKGVGKAVLEAVVTILNDGYMMAMNRFN